MVEITIMSVYICRTYAIIAILITNYMTPLKKLFTVAQDLTR